MMDSFVFWRARAPVLGRIFEDENLHSRVYVYGINLFMLTCVRVNVYASVLAYGCTRV